MIKRLIHFSDLHIRLFKDHELYRGILETGLKEWKSINDDLCLKGIDYINFLEQGGDISKDSQFDHVVEEINSAQIALCEQLKQRAKELINQGKIAAVLGGEHSTPLGLIQAILF